MKDGGKEEGTECAKAQRLQWAWNVWGMEKSVRVEPGVMGGWGQHGANDEPLSLQSTRVVQGLSGPFHPDNPSFRLKTQKLRPHASSSQFSKVTWGMGLGVRPTLPLMSLTSVVASRNLRFLICREQGQ